MSEPSDEQVAGLRALCKGRGGLAGCIAETAEDYTLEWYTGVWEGKGLQRNPKMRPELISKGTTVKIVMHSRFGDVGITNDLQAENGYGIRVDPFTLLNIRRP